ncbi:MAG: restriction endonuclease [Moorea sp. SIOASIH]|uniref:restriction endonuclease n=1 Tax=Moorena sp. SIOASIH TaxID=2607817 RepID=UPI0013B6FD1B|nr:restriction endonuclease [Moorena sp. SIOASIH]NEO39094.1 restriction endonuclease [Moorena sp. SIOASIH]
MDDNLKPATFSLQPSTLNLQPATFNFKPLNLQPSTLAKRPRDRVQPLTFNLKFDLAQKQFTLRFSAFAQA